MRENMMTLELARYVGDHASRITHHVKIFCAVLSRRGALVSVGDALRVKARSAALRCCVRAAFRDGGFVLRSVVCCVLLHVGGFVLRCAAGFFLHYVAWRFLLH